jgi:thiol:disulfide interchange protein DsbD
MLHRNMRGALLLGAVVILLGLMVSAVAGVRSQIPKEPVKWSMKSTSPDTPVKRGDSFTLQMTATIEPGWHLYSTDQEEGGPTPTRIVLASDQPFEQAGGIASTEPKNIMDPNFNLMTQYYEGEATFTMTLKAKAAAPPGKADVKVNVTFQTCSDQLCLPPKTVKLTAAVNVAAR